MTRTAVWMALGAVAMAIASLFACRQIVDFREEPPARSQTGMDAGADANVGAACDLGYGTSRCAACVSANCCRQSSACAANPACAPFAACVGACAGDPTCRAQCALDSPPGSSTEGPALSACLVAQCETACGLTCGGVSNPTSYGGVPPDAAAACQTCIVANGCDEARQCGASADCESLRLCAGICLTPDCLRACHDSDDAGVPSELALAQITGGLCANACARGSDWACVGHVSWPRPAPGDLTLTIQVKDYLHGNTLSGVDVSVCDRKDVTCASAKAHGTTDPAGSVVFQIPNPPDFPMLGLDAYVQLQTPDDAAASTKIVPWLYYFGFPMSESQYVLEDTPSSQLSIKVETPDDANQLAASVGLTYDPSAAYLIAIPTDCEFRLAKGVQITTSPVFPTVRAIYGLDTTNTATDSNGFATFPVLPAGTIDVIATPLALGKPSSRQTVTLRPGWTTAVTMLPTP